MDPFMVDLLEPAVVFATLLGTAFGLKLLIWGKGPLRRVRGGPEHQALEQRLTEVEERLEHVSDLLVQQSEQLTETQERLDFAERVLTQRRLEEPNASESPAH
jgi:ABC-type phosphate transport system auxiliary subunit